MSHDPSSRLFIPLTISDALGVTTVGGALTMPFWQGWLKTMSTDAALFVPIVIVAWTSLLIVDKLWLMALRARHIDGGGAGEPPDVPAA